MEDLIIMKAVAHRPKDMADIAALVDANRDLDLAQIEIWVRQFAEVLELPEVWDDLAVLLRRVD